LFLHDAGKVYELEYASSFEYSNEGQLLGHIVQAVVAVDRHARALEAETQRRFPEGVLTALKHIIVAHHGKYEFGSPKLPAMPEAVIVHHLDNLDAKVTMMLSEIEADPNPSSDWTEFVRPLETKVFKANVME
jgi:3'-5' exoribonuclease